MLDRTCSPVRVLCSNKCSEALLGYFFHKDCAIWSVKDKGSGGQTGTDIFLLSLMTPIPFHGLLSRLNHTHSLKVSLSAPVSLFFLFPAHTSSPPQPPHIDYHICVDMLSYIDVLHSPRWMLFNCIWVSGLLVLKPKDMEFVSLPVQQSQGAAGELTALLESGP